MNNNLPSALVWLHALQPPGIGAASRNGSGESVSGDPAEAKTGRLIIVISLVLLVLCIIALAAVPPTSRDALTHHLAVPKLWIAHGGIVEIPELVFSYYPMNLDLLYVVPLLWGNDIIPKYIHFLFALATAWLIYDYLRRRTTRNMSLLGALLFLSIPVIVKLSINVYVDLGLIFFSWASIVYLCRWARSPQSRRHLIVAAIFCGLGLGTKYNGLIVFFLLTLSIPILYTRTVQRDLRQMKYVIGYPLVFALIALAVFSPWMIRNYVLTNNPIYPLYDEHINGEVGNAQLSNLSMRPWLQRKLIYRESAMETAMIPLRIFFQGEDNDPQLFDGKLNPILLLGPLLLVIRRKTIDSSAKRELFLLAGFAILFLLYASFMVDMRIRYISPIIPPLVVLCILGIDNLLKMMDGITNYNIARLCRATVFAAIFVSIAMNAGYAVALFQSVNPLAFITGETTREQYLSDHLPDYQAIHFANQIQVEDMKIMALFLGNRRYYFDKPVHFENQDFARAVAASANGDTLSSQLKGAGFTHCIIGVQHFEAWVNRAFDDAQKAIVTQWLKEGCRWLYSQNGYIVLELIETSPRQAAVNVLPVTAVLHSPVGNKSISSSLAYPTASDGKCPRNFVSTTGR